MKTNYLIIILLLPVFNDFSQIDLQLAKKLNASADNLEKSSSTLFKLCYSTYEKTQQCDIRYYTTKIDLKLQASIMTLRMYSDLVKFYIISSQNSNTGNHVNEMKKTLSDNNLDLFNLIWNMRHGELMDLYFYISQNKIILTEWNRLNTEIKKVEELLINGGKFLRD